MPGSAAGATASTSRWTDRLPLQQRVAVNACPGKTFCGSGVGTEAGLRATRAPGSWAVLPDDDHAVIRPGGVARLEPLRLGAYWQVKSRDVV